MMIAAAAAAPSPVSLGSSHCHVCHAEGLGCSTSYGSTNSWMQFPFDVHRVSDHSGISFRCENVLFGSTQIHWFAQERDILSRTFVAADYPDSVPDSSNHISNNGYHPLEELRHHRSVRDMKLTAADIARTTVEANNSALLILPGAVHSEPHEENSWSEYQYVIDEYGDMFFEIHDDENIFQDRGANNPVNALIGMDIDQYESKKIDPYDYDILEGGSFPVSKDYFEVEDFEIPDIRVDWGMPDNSTWVHPVYFAKCLSKVLNVEHAKVMDHPSNGVAIMGQLKPAFIDEELYVRKLFNDEGSDDYSPDWKGGEFLSFSGTGDGSYMRSTIYRLEIVRIDLFSVYGVQSEISVEDFQDAEPDILVHSSPALVEQFEEGAKSNFALKALCKKKGLHVEGAHLIGVDSLGMDVRVFSGVEVRTHRFPFKVKATSETAAEKQIQQLLFPRSRRKRIRTPDKAKERDSF